MAQALYDEVNGVYRKVTKKYDGVDGVARNVVKCYDGVEGVARQYFGSSGVKWKKYSCTTSETEKHTKVSSGTPIGLTQTLTNPGSRSLWPGYRFDSSTGKYTCSGTAKTLSVLGEDAVGWGHMYNYYHTNAAHTQYLAFYEITSVTYDSSTGKYTCTYEIKAATKVTMVTNYSKGSTNYGTVTAPEGELPEDGTLVVGKATGDYCVLKIGSTYYYYEKVS